MVDENGSQFVSLSPELKETLECSFQALSSLAVDTPDPAFWLARLEEIVSWLNCPEGLPERLVDLLVTSKRSCLGLHEEVIETALAGGVSPNTRLLMLLDEFVCRASQALIALGPPARDALLRAYVAAAPGSKERRWFLITLSRTGDPELASFFAALKEEDFDPEGMSDALRSFRLEFESRRARREFEKGGEVAIYAALSHENEWCRWAAASDLMRIGDDRAVEALRSLLDDASESVRNNARFGLDWLEQKRSGQSTEKEKK